MRVESEIKIKFISMKIVINHPIILFSNQSLEKKTCFNQFNTIATMTSDNDFESERKIPSKEFRL